MSAGAVLTGGFSLTHGADARGIACALLCAIAYAGMIMFSKKNRSIMGIRNSAIQLTFGFLTALAYCSVKWLSAALGKSCLPTETGFQFLFSGS